MSVPSPSVGLWRRWVLTVGPGELLGFVVPASVGVLTRDLGTPARLAALVLAGGVEGAVLGLAQGLVLRGVLPAFKLRAWVVATAAAAGFAWLLGMTPSATHVTWSAWPWPWTLLAGVVLGLCLLASIGTAQALVLPPKVGRPARWIAWTALGWCVGLAAFAAVAPPLWHVGQPMGETVSVGAAGGLAMAFAMAAVTGVAVVRLRVQAVAAAQGADLLAGRRTLTSLLGTPVFTPSGEAAGRVRDLVVDLGADVDRPPVTGLMVGGALHPDRIVAWAGVAAREGRPGLVVEDGGRRTVDPLGPAEVLARRDLLDAPAVLVAPPRRARVSDVVLDLGPGRAWVAGVDLAASSALRRLRGQAFVAGAAVVPLSQAHISSTRAHAVQLAAPGALVTRAAPQELAEVLTRVSVAHARDIADAADPGLVRRALPLLHPHVRDRLTGGVVGARRTRRLDGWRHRR